VSGTLAGFVGDWLELMLRRAEKNEEMISIG